MEQETFDVDSLNFPEITTEGDTSPQTGNEATTKVDNVSDTKVEVQPEVKQEVKTESKTEETTTVTKDIKISDPPSKYEGESDIQYNIRKQIYDAGQAKAQATSEEEKSELAKHIKSLRKELAISNKSSEAVPAQEKIETTESQAQGQSEEELAKEALRKMGYLSKDEVEAMVQNLVTTQKTQEEHLAATREFYSSNKDIAANPAQRDVLEKFVVDNFNITPQSSKQQLLMAMDMARTYLFPKVDNRAQRAAESADKRDLVSFSSNTQTVKTVSKEDQKTTDVLKELGMSADEFGWS